MKEYFKQIYNEGLGLTIYKPVENKIQKLQNSKIKKIIIGIYKVLYFIFAIMISLALFLFTYPL